MPKRNNTIRYLLAGVLGLFLVYAIYDGFFAPRKDVLEDPIVSSEPVAVGPEQESDDPPEAVPYWRLPLGSLRSAISYSPFSLDGTHALEVEGSVEFADDDAADLDSDDLLSVAEESMGVPLSSSVEIILETSRGRVAKVGDQILREGSELGPGLLVNRIEDRKIVLVLERKQKNDEESDE